MCACAWVRVDLIIHVASFPTLLRTTLLEFFLKILRLLHTCCADPLSDFVCTFHVHMSDLPAKVFLHIYMRLFFQFALRCKKIFKNNMLRKVCEVKFVTGVKNKSLRPSAV